MKERPILFSDEMVRAILDGRKAQTRRVVKMPRSWDCIAYADWGYGWWPYRSDDGESPNYDNNEIPMNCPYGKPGDRLWVRETWSEEHPLAIQEGRYSQTGRAGIPGPPPVSYRVIYRADGEPRQVWKNRGGHPYYTLEGPADDIDANYPTVSSNYTRGNGNGVHWNSSIHMPRWASRILLEITAVRVERLQDITEGDAQAEGAFFTDYGRRCHHAGPPRDASECPEPDEHHPQCAGWSMVPTDSHEQCLLCPRMAFANLWDSINGAGSWEANPWVWVVDFRRIAP